jgi:PadR family transcriptional regulator PadR
LLVGAGIIGGCRERIGDVLVAEEVHSVWQFSCSAGPHYRARNVSDPMIHLELLQGTLDMLIFQTLTHGPRHGYAIAGFITESSNGRLRILDGALYAALHRLERSGFVDAAWGVSNSGRRARFYKLTAQGRVAARAEARRWQRYTSVVAKVMTARPAPENASPDAASQPQDDLSEATD